jgi:non-specific protein-tyrosine kinase
MAEASAGSRVCLVEADLRKPDFASATGLRELPGLVEVLTGQSAFDDAVQQLSGPNGAPVGRHIDVIVAGATPANPVELTESREMQELATQIGARYDLVVVDAPPPTLLADAIPLLKLADGVLVVAQVNKVTPEALGRLREELVSLDVRVLGIVGNRAATGREARYGEHYRNYRAPAGARLGGLSGAESRQGTPGQEPPTTSPVARKGEPAGGS